MVRLLCFIFIILFQAVVIRTELAQKVQNELSLLEDVTYYPLNSGLDRLEDELDAIALNSTQLQDEANNLVREHALDLAENIQFLIETFAANGVNVTASCQEDVSEIIDKIQDKAFLKIREAISDNISHGQTIVSNTMAVLAIVQNKTSEVVGMAENCLKLADNDECLLKVLGVIEIKKKTLYPIVTVAITEHQAQLKMLEYGITSDLQKITNGVLGEYIHILDDFLMCII